MIGPPPTLDELAASFGDPDPADLWPVLRFVVPPAVLARWKTVLAERGGDEVRVFAGLVGYDGPWA
jgi:hypothetical protein